MPKFAINLLTEEAIAAVRMFFPNLTSADPEFTNAILLFRRGWDLHQQKLNDLVDFLEIHQFESNVPPPKSKTPAPRLTLVTLEKAPE